MNIEWILNNFYSNWIIIIWNYFNYFSNDLETLKMNMYWKENNKENDLCCFLSFFLFHWFESGRCQLLVVNSRTPYNACDREIRLIINGGKCTHRFKVNGAWQWSQYCPPMFVCHCPRFGSKSLRMEMQQKRIAYGKGRRHVWERDDDKDNENKDDRQKSHSIHKTISLISLIWFSNSYTIDMKNDLYPKISG